MRFFLVITIAFVSFTATAQTDTLNLYRFTSEGQTLLIGGFTQTSFDKAAHSRTFSNGIMEANFARDEQFSMTGKLVITMGGDTLMIFEVVEVVDWRCACPPRLAMAAEGSRYLWNTDPAGREGLLYFDDSDNK